MRPRKKQHGQVAVFYALLIPVFLLMGGVGLDLGWYYLNVSRLQNAADAAVIVGAKALLSEIKYKDTEETLADKNYEVKLVSIPECINDPNKEVADVSNIGHTAALAYAKKNLADDSVSCAPPNLFSIAEAEQLTNDFKDAYASSGENKKVTFKSSLYKNGDYYYYVVNMEEDIHHFFVAFNPLTGDLDDMHAGITAVALLSKNGAEPPEEDPSDPTQPEPTVDLEIAFNSNGGEFIKDGKSTNETPKLYVDESQDDDTQVTVGLPSDYSVQPPQGYVFSGWNTSSDGSGNNISDNVTLTLADIKNLIESAGKDGSVTLYAIYEKDESSDTAQDSISEGLSIYGAMKGYKDDEKGVVRMGLEELMTYRTWMYLYNKGVDPDSTISFATSSSYVSGSGYAYRTETSNITPRTNAYDWTAFFDLGSDLTYEDYHTGRNGWGGLFKKSFDSSDIQSDNVNAFNYLKNTTDLVNSYTYSCLYGTQGTNYKLLLNNSGKQYSPSSNEFSRLKYRVHTSFNINKVWPVRANKTRPQAYIDRYNDLDKPVPDAPESDPLYVRIESEELNEGDKDRQNTTVRQMFINVKADNTIETTSTVEVPTTTTTTTTTLKYDDGYREVKFYNDSKTYVAKVGTTTSAPRYYSDRVYVNGNYSYTEKETYKDWLGLTQTRTVTYYYTIEGEKYSDYSKSGKDFIITTTIQNTTTVTVTSKPYRPLIIFYEGPDRGLTEAYDTAEISGEQTQNPKAAYPYLTMRDPQPVILNLQTDFRGILFAPNSPVIIKGNGHKMQGFVVAKEFRDFADSGGIQIKENDLTFRIDKWGNVLTKDLPDSAKRRPLQGELPYNATSYSDYVNNYSSHFNNFKKSNLENEEYVYYLSTFNLSDKSYYDSFNIPELKRSVYSFLDNYQIEGAKKSVDMFFSTIRSKWIS